MVREIAVATTAKFHSFDVARELSQRQLLRQIYTAYPERKVVGEAIPTDLLTSLPNAFVPYAALRRVSPRSWLTREARLWSQVAFGRMVARRISLDAHFTGMSGSSLEPGLRAQAAGQAFVVRRGSTHIEDQDDILAAENAKWGIPFRRNDPRIIERELREYEAADLIAVPSTFARESFLSRGVAPRKVLLTPYGVDLTRFKRVGEPPHDSFEVVFVGEFSLRKGVQYLLQAFDQVKFTRKRLTFIGAVDQQLLRLLSDRRLVPENVQVLGHVAQSSLSSHLSESHVLVLPSVEDGFGVAMAQALACGCPVIASTSTGASNLFTDGQEGYIVRPGDVESLASRLNHLSANAELQRRLSEAALTRARSMSGWGPYVDRLVAALEHLEDQRDVSVG